jgi:hypothetical protein
MNTYPVYMQRGGVGVETKFGGSARRGGRDRKWFSRGEGEVGRNLRNPANDTAISRGVVGYGMGWVRGRSLVVARGVVVETVRGFRGGTGR